MSCMIRFILTLLFVLFFSICVHAAQLVLVTNATYQKEVNNINDIISIHDDDVLLDGNGYLTAKIISVKGTAEFVRNELVKKLPDTSDLTKQEIEKRLSTPKYRFKVLDETKNTIAEMCGTNVVLAPAK